MVDIESFGQSGDYTNTTRALKHEMHGTFTALTFDAHDELRVWEGSLEHTGDSVG